MDDKLISCLFRKESGVNINPEVMIQVLEEYRDNIEYDFTADDAVEMLEEIIDEIKRGIK